MLGKRKIGTAVAVTGSLLACAGATAQSAPQTIGLGQSVKGAIAAATPAASDKAHDCYALSAATGQSVTLKLSSTAFAPKLSVGRGANCLGASFQFVKTGAGEAEVTFKPAPGRYMVMVQAADAGSGAYTLSSDGSAPMEVADAGPSRREIMEAQVGKRRAEVAEEERRRAEEERRREEAHQAELERIRQMDEEARIAREAEEAEEAAEEAARPRVDPMASFVNTFNSEMQKNAQERARQQAWLDDLAAQQRQAQQAREQRAELARQQAAARDAQARQLAAASAAQRQAAAETLARQQREQQLAQNQRLEQQRIAQQRAQQQAAQQRQQQLAQQQAAQQRFTPAGPSRPPSSVAPGQASTRDDPGRCVTRPTVKAASCKGGLEASVINGCGQPVDVRLCLKRNGAWACVSSYGVPSQERFSHQICTGAESESFMSTRYSSDMKTPLASPP